VWPTDPPPSLGITPDAILRLIVIEVGQQDGADNANDAVNGLAGGRLSDEHLRATGRARTFVERRQRQPTKLLRMRSDPLSSSLIGQVQHRLLDDMARAEFVGSQAREGINLHHLIPVMALIERRLPLGEYLSLAVGTVLGGTGTRMDTDLVLHDT
jgi:hypothetical protein